ncbi:helix-turn-helix DNA binding protein [Gordonia phage Woes]|uniref:Helix-turn-helix DNA binding protein n=13 Tax=Woesvirus woes TaxID=1982751 RepID=A0A482JJT4_9CAUD|nr:helix-turn-helix DNA binding protein [Gordonia phage Woes]ATW61156.1 helix-turn-helix DNA binding protein [Gordonia phage Anamika]AVP43245.1 helix-turn-helix DNA binding protein [Gordonia phage Hail2Pitt]QAX94344.1 helix-turn-helix DNA binding protein [Gordonia phage Guillaume]QAX94667.1 helix-turn-helix DNA binding protein [Gordonia phage Harambe]QAX95330.1 helix-turn-helix DNA binding protein [Gordonia phage Hello]QAX95422.1 helix-turn-helix DNA binding protein [Gordonia phage Neoevie]Q
MSSFDEDVMTSEVHFPAREFFYTIQQVGLMLDCSTEYLEERVLFLAGRSVGSMKNRLRAINIAAPDQKPIWRVAETDFKLWLKHKGIRYSEKVNSRLMAKKRPQSFG